MCMLIIIKCIHPAYNANCNYIYGTELLIIRILLLLCARGGGGEGGYAVLLTSRKTDRENIIVQGGPEKNKPKLFLIIYRIFS